MGKKIKLLFTGDLCFSGAFERRLREGEEVFSPQLAQLLHTQDHCIGNLEGPLVSTRTKEAYQAKITNPPACLSYLLQKNIRVFSLANNHSFDCGKEGFLQTREQLSDAEALWFGAGETKSEAQQMIVLRQGDFKLGVFGLSFREGMIASQSHAGVFYTRSISELSLLVKEMQKEVDMLILCYHGEEEYTQFPMPARRKFLSRLCKLEIDAIVCHHPHVLQGIEYVDGVPICYSLGNTVFDVEGHHNRSFTEIGGLLLLELEEQQVHLRLQGISLDRKKGTISLLEDAVRLAHIEGLNNFTNYRRSWQQEAYRVFQERHVSTDSQTPSSTKQQTKKKWRLMLEKLSRASFYRTFFATIRYPNSRAVFLAAMIYQLRKATIDRP